MASERNLLLRIASAVVGLPLLFGLVLWREPLGFGLFALVAVALGLVEYTSLTLRGRPTMERALVVVIGTAFAAAVYFRPDLTAAWAMAAVVLTGATAVFQARPDDIPTAGGRFAAAGFGVFYVSLLVALPLLHRMEPHGSWWVILALSVTFANDTGAYIVGRTLGRHKLAPAVSPAKSVEGAVGGMAASIGLTFAARATVFPALTVRDALMIGAVAGIVGPLGDLCESLLKRSAGAKDSGNLIPGHGGILDRIDAVLFVGAYVLLHVRLFG